MAICETQVIPGIGEQKKTYDELYTDAKESFPNTSGIFHLGLRGFINFFGRKPRDHGEVNEWISLNRNPEEILKVELVEVVEVVEVWEIWVDVDPKRPGYGYWKRVTSKDLKGDY